MENRPDGGVHWSHDKEQRFTHATEAVEEALSPVIERLRSEGYSDKEIIGAIRFVARKRSD